MLTTLALSLLLSQSDVTPPPPPPPLEVQPMARSASLIRSEIAQLEAELTTLKIKPAWVPLVAGFAGFTGAIALGFVAVFAFAPLGWTGLGLIILSWAVLAVAGIAGLIVGIVISSVNATKNKEKAVRREIVDERLRYLKDELQRSTARLEPWRGGLADVTPMATVLTF